MRSSSKGVIRSLEGTFTDSFSFKEVYYCSRCCQDFLDVTDLCWGHADDVGISKNRGTPINGMVKIMETTIQVDDLGGKPTIFGNVHVMIQLKCVEKLEGYPS